MKEKKEFTLETVKPGFANGISTQLYEKQLIEGPQACLSEEEKQHIIETAAKHYGEFLHALGCTWEDDPNSNRTPYRVAKSYVNDLWAGRFNPAPAVTSFPSDSYDGMVFEGGIPLTSQCSHHSQPILGRVHIAYVPSPEGKVVGLSKLNRIVEYFGRRGQIQEAMTVALHQAVDKICEGNLGVAVMVEATHQCVSCRGVKHSGASMKTSKLSGCFMDESPTRAEFYEFVRGCAK